MKQTLELKDVPDYIVRDYESQSSSRMCYLHSDFKSTSLQARLICFDRSGSKLTITQRHLFDSLNPPSPSPTTPNGLNGVGFPPPSTSTHPHASPQSISVKDNPDKSIEDYQPYYTRHNLRERLLTPASNFLTRYISNFTNGKHAELAKTLAASFYHGYPLQFAQKVYLKVTSKTPPDSDL